LPSPDKVIETLPESVALLLVVTVNTLSLVTEATEKEPSVGDPLAVEV